MSAEKSTRTPRGRLPLTVTVGDGTSPSPVSAVKVPYLTDTVTPKTRRVSKLPAAERKLALDLACRCVEEAYQAREGPALQHAAHFRAFGYKVLKKALCLKDDPRTPQDMQETSEEESVSSAVDSEALTDTAASDRRTVSPAKHRRMPGLWRTVQQLRKEIAGAAVPSPERNGFFSPRTADSLPPDEEPSCSTERPTASERAAGPEKELDALLLAAPNKGEARVAKYIACEEEWLRLLVQELTPVMEHLQDQELPLNTMHALERVADRALQVGEAAVCSYRSHRSSQAQNAAILYRAVHLNSAAMSRFHSLISSVGAPKVSPTSRTMAAPSEAHSVGGLLAVVEQLVQDVAEDAEVYQQSFPESASISLPAISARVCCQQLRPQLQAVLDRQPPANRAFFDPLEAVHQFECHALRWCPSVLGPEGAFVDDEGQPMFLPHVEQWLKAMRIKLTQWSTRLLAQETWTSVSEGGVRCSKALVDMYTALCSVNASVAATNIAYAALLEKALSKVALQHVVSLEKLCQASRWPAVGPASVTCLPSSYTCSKPAAC
ncbi:g6941 [Coccomyxa elongata]